MDEPNFRKIGQSAFVIANEMLFEKLTKRFYNDCIGMGFVTSEVIEADFFPFSDAELEALSRGVIQTRMREVFPEISQEDFEVSVSRQVREKYGFAFVISILASLQEHGLTFVKHNSMTTEIGAD